MHTIELDYAGHTTLGQLSDDLVKHNLRIVKYVPHGPGGGNPCITFGADNPSDIERFLLDYAPDEDPGFYMKQVVDTGPKPLYRLLQSE